MYITLTFCSFYSFYWNNQKESSYEATLKIKPSTNLSVKHVEKYNVGNTFLDSYATSYDTSQIYENVLITIIPIKKYSTKS